MLGLNTSYKSVDKMLPVPEISLSQTGELASSFLSSLADNLQILQSLRAQATEPQKIDRFIEIVKRGSRVSPPPVRPAH